jgi:hypothetical protein
LLVLPLVWLLVSFDRRLEAQRRVRHEVVAERLFDEVERELTLVLNELAEVAERAGAGGALPTAVNRAPYVLGFFVRERGELRGLGVPDAEPERERRWLAALERLQNLEHRRASGGAPASPAREEASDAESPRYGAPASRAPWPAAEAPKSSPAEVLRKLNRADDYRRRGSIRSDDDAPAGAQ